MKRAYAAGLLLVAFSAFAAEFDGDAVFQKAAVAGPASTPDLDKAAADADRAYQTCLPGVTVITFGPVTKPQGLGSGFFVDDKRGLIVTNNHVVENAGGKVHVYNTLHGKAWDGDGVVVATDPVWDLALVKVDAAGLDFTALRFISEFTAKPTNPVIAIGSALGIGIGPTPGTVRRQPKPGTDPGDFTQNHIQVSISINEGNSGGPLVDRHGYVLGVNQVKLRDTEGLAFAIPSSVVERFLAKNGVAALH